MDIGLIGCGVWGAKILRELVAMDCSVVVFDINRGQLDLEMSPLVTYVDELDDLIAASDGIIVATPATTHRSVVESLDALGNTVPVFCEKPLASNLEDARWFLEREGAPVFVMHIWTFHGAIRKLKSLYENGEIGELTLIKSFRANWTSPRRDVDTWMNLAPHDVSIITYITEERLKPINAFFEESDGRCVGCVAHFTVAKDVPCVIEVSNRYELKIREVRLHGTKGVLVLPSDSGEPIRCIRNGGFIVPDTVEFFDYDSKSALAVELEAFLEYLKAGNTPLPTVQDGFEVVEILESIRDISAKNKIR